MKRTLVHEYQQPVEWTQPFSNLPEQAGRHSAWYDSRKGATFPSFHTTLPTTTQVMLPKEKGKEIMFIRSVLWNVNESELVYMGVLKWNWSLIVGSAFCQF